MNGAVLLYVGALVTAGWGVSHLFPTRKVVSGFGAISDDNRRIITMEWISEGVALIFIGALTAMVTYLDRTASTSRTIYWLIFCGLNTLSVVSLFTGFRNSSFPFKLCPFIFTGASILIVVGSHMD